MAGRVPDRGFELVVALVEGAKEDLVAAVPSPRGAPGRPVADALVSFETGLRRAREELGRTDETVDDEVLRSCRAAIDAALAGAVRVRLEAPPLDYEGLVTMIGDLIDPLAAFAGAVQSTRRR